MPSLDIAMPRPILPAAYDVQGAWNDNDSWIILVRLPTNRVTPWATYRMDRDGNCYSGDYMYLRPDQVEEAALAWMQRAHLYQTVIEDGRRQRRSA